jgi:hypothetical protein
MNANGSDPNSLYERAANSSEQRITGGKRYDVPPGNLAEQLW